MAAPNACTIENLSGTWTMQGINWVVRRAIGLAEVTVKKHQFVSNHPGTSTPRVQIAIVQTTSTGMGGTLDNRYLDWSENHQEDRLFGNTKVQTRFIGGSSSDGMVLPDLELQTPIDDPNILKFLRGEIGDNLEPSEGYLVEAPKGVFPGVVNEEGLWIHVFIRNQTGLWRVEQVWGFENINNERRLVRRTVSSDNKGNHQLGRLVYNFKDSQYE
ncbi:hypothetical protein Micbo1qcDRAFT_186843 [Microdochium bolleyi]|uniref:Calycin-like protein n=1 Tax=Microdochium bolleyi TaxID=196109 RepID=A0A136IJ73_9PEZI|nr:hypothetical protein Micbo1qcDRAFT_186843 [Microdochium bolleyi]